MLEAEYELDESKKLMGHSHRRYLTLFPKKHNQVLTGEDKKKSHSSGRGRVRVSIGKYNQSLLYNKSLLSRKKRLCMSLIPARGRKFLLLQLTPEFLSHLREENIVNRGQVFKEMNWKCCSQNRE